MIYHGTTCIIKDGIPHIKRKREGGRERERERESEREREIEKWIARVTVDQIDHTSDSCVLHLTVLRRLYLEGLLGEQRFN